MTQTRAKRERALVKRVRWQYAGSVDGDPSDMSDAEADAVVADFSLDHPPPEAQRLPVAVREWLIAALHTSACFPASGRELREKYADSILRDVGPPPSAPDAPPGETGHRAKAWWYMDAAGKITYSWERESLVAWRDGDHRRHGPGQDCYDAEEGDTFDSRMCIPGPSAPDAGDTKAWADRLVEVSRASYADGERAGREAVAPDAGVRAAALEDLRGLVADAASEGAQAAKAVCGKNAGAWPTEGPCEECGGAKGGCDACYGCGLELTPASPMTDAIDFDALITQHLGAHARGPSPGHTTTGAVNAALRDYPDADVSALWVPATEALDYQHAWKRDLEKGRRATEAARDAALEEAARVCEAQQATRSADGRPACRTCGCFESGPVTHRAPCIVAAIRALASAPPSEPTREAAPLSHEAGMRIAEEVREQTYDATVKASTQPGRVWPRVEASVDLAAIVAKHTAPSTAAPSVVAPTPAPTEPVVMRGLPVIRTCGECGFCRSFGTDSNERGVAYLCDHTRASADTDVSTFDDDAQAPPAWCPLREHSGRDGGTL